MALEKVGRARLAYKLMTDGWQVGEAYDDGYDLLAYHQRNNVACRIELKAMDITNRTDEGNLTAPVSPTEQEHCTHIVVYVEPHGWFFIARKDRILTEKGNIYAALNKKRQLRTPRVGSRSFTPYKDQWSQLFE